MFKLLNIFFMFMIVPTMFVSGAVSSLDQKVRYERSLEQKADEMLLKVLGPNQARVSVDSVLKIEQVLGGKKGVAAASGRFEWLETERKKEDARELLPGFTASSPIVPMGEEEAEAYSYKVERLTAAIILNNAVPQEQVVSITEVVSMALGLNEKRGDTVEVVRAQFAPVWKNIWYSPEYMGIFARYGMIALVMMISFALLSLGIIKMAGAMSKMAKAQEYKVSMGYGGGEGGAMGGPIEGAEAGVEGVGKVEAAGAIEHQVEEAEDGRVYFNVRKDQIPLLVHMMRKEDPENLALLVYHLKDDVRSGFLSGIGKEKASLVMMNLAKVRFVDRGMISGIKEEIEGRLESAVGGVHKVIEILSPMDYSDRKQMIKSFEEGDPGLAVELRKEMILDDDLVLLKDNEMGILASSMTAVQWAEVFPALSEELKARLKAQFSEKTVQMIEQTIGFSAHDQKKADAAMNKLMVLVGELINGGRIGRPERASAAGIPALPESGDLKEETV